MTDRISALGLKMHGLFDELTSMLKGKLDKTARAADSSKLNGKTFEQLMVSTSGNKGELPFIGADNTIMAFAPAALLTSIRMASTDSDISAMKNSVQSMTDVFAKWGRISHNANGVYPAIPAELNAWSLDEVNDTVKCTINSSSLIGFVSPYAFDEYTFDVVVSSTDADDDGTGLILAFKSVGGVENTLVAQITTGGLDWNSFGSVTPRFNVVVNMAQGTARGAALLFSKELGPARQGYNGADFKDGVRIRAVRSLNGDMVVKVTKPDGTDFSGGEAKWVGKLPTQFQSKCAIGYFAYSQNSTSYKNITVPQPKTDIVDVRNADLHRWSTVNSAWSIVGKADALLPKGRLYRNTEGTQASYYLDFEGKFVGLTSPKAKIVVNEYLTLATDGSKQYDLQSLLGSLVSSFDLKTADIQVLVKDTNGSSPLVGCYVNAEAFVSYGIKDERYVVIANQSGSAENLYVKVTVQPT